MDISKIDKNFALGAVDADGLVFRASTEEPFRVYGVMRERGVYCRIPDEVAKATSEEVAIISRHTAGGRIRFITDSQRIAIDARFPDVKRMAHMAFSGIYGFDIYADNEYAHSFIPPTEATDGYKSIRELGEKKERLITINMPLYNTLSEVYIGLDEGAVIKEAPDYSIEVPIVFYGSSITQGGCASRPGSCYTSIVSRRLDANHLNLGFSGSARGEAAIREYIASLDMSAFVLDYDYNAYSPEELEETHAPFFRAVREAHPTIPIVIMTRPRTVLSESEKRRRLTCLTTYESAVKAGDKNVYFIDGTTLFGEVSFDATVDRIHPTDLGFYLMARALHPVLKNALKEE